MVCRPSFYERYAYCCDETEIGSRSCGGPDAFCTTESLNLVMNAFACPYSFGYCGASSSELVMHPVTRNNLKIEISNRLFVDAETCYYIFSVPTSDIDLENYRYFWDIEIYELTNVIIQINNGTALETANDPISVGFSTGYRFQYTAESNNVYIAFTGDVPSTSSNDPAFGFTIKLRSFDIRPVVVVFPDDEPVDDTTDPTDETNPDAVEDPETPVTIIPDDEEQTNNTDVQQVTEQIEYITVPATPKEDKPRKKQLGLTALTVAITLGIVVYIIAEVCDKCKKK